MMKIETINQPLYKITLTAEEIGWLWTIMYNAYHDHGTKHAYHFYDKLENVRPAGGFEQ